MTRSRFPQALALAVVLALSDAGAASAAELRVEPAVDVPPGTALEVRGTGFLSPLLGEDCELRYTSVETGETTPVGCDPVGEFGGAGGFDAGEPGEYVVQGCVPTCDHPRAGRVTAGLVVERTKVPPVVDPAPLTERVPATPALRIAPALDVSRLLPLAVAGEPAISVRPERVEEGGFVVVEFVAPPQEVPATCTLLWAGAPLDSATCRVGRDGVLVGSLVVPVAATGSYPVRACRPDCAEPAAGASEAVVAVLVPPVVTTATATRPTTATTTAVVPVPVRTTPALETTTGTVPGVREPSVVPRLTAMTPGQVEAVLPPGLRLGSVTGEGRVVQQDPPPGAVVSPGTAVDVVLAPDVPVPQVAVPSVVGQSVEAARAALAQLGLALAGDPPADGRIETQDPAPGALVNPGSLVAVELELAAETVAATATPWWRWPGALLLGAALLLAGAAGGAGRTWWRGHHPLPRPALRVYPDQTPSLRTEEEVPDHPGLRLLVRGYPDLDPTVVTEVTP